MKLIVLEGPASGRAFPIDRDVSLEVGRAPQVDFSLPQDPHLSRRHFSLTCEDGGCRIQDLGSANGTALDTGQRATTGVPIPVLPGQRIRAGSSVFTLIEEDGARTHVPGVPGLRLTNATPFPAAMMLWEHPPGRTNVSVIVKATFEIGANGDIKIAGRQIPVFRSDQATDERAEAQPRFESDMVPWKVRTDILLVGHAYAPGGVAVEGLHARLEVGSLRHAVAIHGDRHWLFDPLAGITRPVITRPIPFTKMPLGYERAFGGFDKRASRYCENNLAGRGFIGACTPQSVHGVRLPNLERVDSQIRKWDDHPSPVGFGAYGRGWMPRLGHANRLTESLVGEEPSSETVDEGLAFYNSAHPELQIAGYLRGDETVTLTNLSDVPKLRFNLMPLPLRVGIAGVTAMDHAADEARTAVQSDVDAMQIQEAAANLDTLVLIPDEHRFYQVFRAIVDLSKFGEDALCEISIRLRASP
ncbi:FHA domain protein [Caballeronia pedi]|uniref:FHA domain protein n=1 Tax=Caballeronia pedi TaxID=1777141 RepID=A0A158D8K3_9BURK|nr:DUF2169 domain-containing protein [Caballeronia pedi]SAK90097.1 FHA domain protein [Caballeronia pedi]